MQNIGRYVVTGEIARGGAGVVYRGRDPATNQEVAIKLLVGARDPDVQRRRFLREVQALQKIVHPGVVRVLDCGVAAGHPFLVMDFVDGPTLQDRLDREGALGFCSILVGAESGLLSAAKKHGISTGNINGNRE